MPWKIVLIWSKHTSYHLSNMAMFIVIFGFVLIWQEQYNPISEATFCFMDAVLWVDALDGFYVQDQMVVNQLDRPPLSLWLGSWLKHWGLSSTAALQMVARIGLAGVFASMWVFLFRSYSLLTAILGILILSRASSFVRLSVWLNAQMICNFFFAAHMCFGYHLIHSTKNIRTQNWKWIWVGLFGGAAIASKEQGLILVPMTLLFIVIQTKHIRNKIQSSLYYILGCIPLSSWYFYFLKEQLIYGEKWRIFSEDLELLQKQSSFDDILGVKTTWGSFSHRFGQQEGFGDLLQQSSQILLRDLYAPTIAIPLIGIGTFIVVLCNTRLKKNANFGGLMWCFVHLLTVVPLLVVPIFEPYHYSIVMIGGIGVLGWSIHALQKMSFLTIPVILLGVMYSLDNWGVKYTRSIELELQSCVSNRIRSVRDWARGHLSSKAVLFFTESSIYRDTLHYPQWISTYPKLQKCKENYYVVSSGLANQQEIFEEDRIENPNLWTKVHQIEAINKELWFVYKMNCD